MTATREMKQLNHVFHSTVSGVDRAIEAGLFSWDTSANLVYADAVVAMIYGVDPGEAKDGLPLDVFLGNILPKDRDRVRETIAASVEHGKQIQIKYRVLRPDGSVVTAMGFGQCFYSETGEPIQYSGIVVPLSADDEPENAVIVQVLAAYQSLRDIGAEDAAEKVLQAMELVLHSDGRPLLKH